MIEELTHSITTFVDLTALITLIGAVWCRLWMVQLTCEGTVCPAVFFNRLRRLLAICLVAVVVSSIANLGERTVEMSGSGVANILTLLPTVLLKTHYGSMWFLRIAGVVGAWIVWWTGRRYMSSRFIAVLLLCCGGVIAFSRSASGHAADFGDFSIQQLADFVHLLVAASWGGAVIALAGIIPSSNQQAAEETLRDFISAIADRFYVLFGPALSLLVLTGLYSAWLQVGSFHALWLTTYGGILSAKLLLFCILTIRYVIPPHHGSDSGTFVLEFVRRVRVEAVMVVTIMFCVAVLTHQVPARHHSHHDMMNHGHGMGHGQGME